MYLKWTPSPSTHIIMIVIASKPFSIGLKLFVTFEMIIKHLLEKTFQFIVSRTEAHSSDEGDIITHSIVHSYMCVKFSSF